jgi:peptidoglycan hydrolase CwlO-like protein
MKKNMIIVSLVCISACFAQMTRTASIREYVAEKLDALEAKLQEKPTNKTLVEANEFLTRLKAEIEALATEEEARYKVGDQINELRDELREKIEELRQRTVEEFESE